jgi:hypothetical protein
VHEQRRGSIDHHRVVECVPPSRKKDILAVLDRVLDRGERVDGDEIVVARGARGARDGARYDAKQGPGGQRGHTQRHHQREPRRRLPAHPPPDRARCCSQKTGRRHRSARKAELRVRLSASSLSTRGPYPCLQHRKATFRLLRTVPATSPFPECYMIPTILGTFTWPPGPHRASNLGPADCRSAAQIDLGAHRS